jgi:hypothetical protein
MPGEYTWKIHLQHSVTCSVTYDAKSYDDDSFSDCHGAPLLPLHYIPLNMTFNISSLNLVKMSTALVASLASTLAGSISLFLLNHPAELRN